MQLESPLARTPTSFRPLRALLRLALALLVLFGAAACEKPGGLVILDPQDPARDYDVDLGRLPYGDEREHVVRMRNEEGRAVTIRDVQAGCTCTVARLAYVDASGARVEAPGLLREKPFVLPERAVLEVKLHVQSRSVPNPNSVKRVLVRILSDSAVDPAKTLEVHLVVEMPFLVVPKNITLGQVPIGGIAQGKTDITPALGTGELITGVLSKPDNMDVVLETPSDLGLFLWRLHIRWFPPLARGAQMRSVVLSTTGPDGKGEGRPLEVEVYAIGVDNVIAQPMLFSLPRRLEANAGAGAIKLQSLVGGNRLLVTGARVEGPFAECFTATAMADRPDSQGRSESWIVQLTCTKAPASDGAFGGHVVVSLDDPVTPEVRIPYQHRAQP